MRNKYQLLDYLIVDDTLPENCQIYRTRKGLKNDGSPNINVNDVDEYKYPYKAIPMNRWNKLGRPVFYGAFTIDTTIFESYNKYCPLFSGNTQESYNDLVKYLTQKVYCFTSEWKLKDNSRKFKFVNFNNVINELDSICEKKKISNKDTLALKKLCLDISEYIEEPSKYYYTKTAEIGDYLLNIKGCDFILYKSVQTMQAFKYVNRIEADGVNAFLCIVASRDFTDNELWLNTVYETTYAETLGQFYTEILKSKQMIDIDPNDTTKIKIQASLLKYAVVNTNQFGIRQIDGWDDYELNKIKKKFNNLILKITK